jgi:signal transduction histidine kinase/CheY-like chemotaxis protein
MSILRDELIGIGEADRKRLAGSLNRLEEHLRDLKDDRDRAERALETQTEYVTTVCHEVRTQLGAVFSFSDLLLGTGLDATQRDFATQLRSCAGDLLALLNNVLDNAKLSEGRVELVAEDFSFHDLIASVSRTVCARCRAKDLRCAVTVSGDVPAILAGDRMRINQVLMNLVDNAIKFTERGNITVHVERLASLDDRVRLRFSVRDTGTGISEAAREHLFKAYSQVDRAANGAYGGTGLGLVIAAKLVSLMGGKIGCDSIPGEGSIFWFTTPLDTMADHDTADAELFEDETVAVVADDGDGDVEPAPPPLNADGTRPAHILVVEDNRVNQMLVATYLTKFGHTFSVVENGGDAIEAVKHQYYDLILMDIHMPDMDGLQTAQEIRELGGHRAMMPIIAVTANALHARRRTYLQAGMDACLTKPIDAMQMFTTIADHLQDPATRRLPMRAHNDDSDLFRETVGLA